jgi:hypothetical protein
MGGPTTQEFGRIGAEWLECSEKYVQEVSISGMTLLVIE